MRRRDQLDAHAHMAMFAGEHRTMRRHWLLKARFRKRRSASPATEDDRHAVAFYVLLARSAHRAYVKELNRALTVQRRLHRARAVA